MAKNTFFLKSSMQRTIWRTAFDAMTVCDDGRDILSHLIEHDLELQLVDTTESIDAELIDMYEVGRVTINMHDFTTVRPQDIISVSLGYCLESIAHEVLHSTQNLSDSYPGVSKENRSEEQFVHDFLCIQEAPARYAQFRLAQSMEGAGAAFDVSLSVLKIAHQFNAYREAYIAENSIQGADEFAHAQSLIWLENKLLDGEMGGAGWRTLAKRIYHNEITQDDTKIICIEGGVFQMSDFSR